MTATALLPTWPLKAAGSVLVGLLVVRLFTIMHDGAHGAIFRHSRAGRALTTVLGWYTLNTRTTWEDVHGLHHRTVGRPLRSDLSAYTTGDLINRTLTVAQWASLSPRDRLRVRLLRHPVVMLAGLFTAFMAGHCVVPFLKDPRRHWDGPLVLGGYVAAVLGCARWLGWEDALFVLVLPHAIGACMGAFIFYAQHNYPGALIRTEAQWHPIDAAVHASSFFDMSRVMHWFTGNIGYHHVHHVNNKIPFYRLPEAMAALPELHFPGRITWHPRDVLACLRSSVWDASSERLVSFAEADRRAARLSDPATARDAAARAA